MAEITSNTADKRQKGGVRRSKKLSTKVDLTPMVDLGFLLITFFVFTSAISKPNKIDIFLPAGNITNMPLGESAALTIIPVSNNKVFYYHGALDKALETNLYGTTTFALKNGIGDIIRLKQKMLALHPPLKKEDLMLIIKPTPNATYQNVVDIVDEVEINQLKHHAFVDLNDFETETLLKLKVQ